MTHRKILLFFTLASVLLPGKLHTAQPVPTRYPKDYLYTMHQDPWKFFEQIFIIEPEMELSSRKIKLHRTIGGMLELSPGAMWFFYKALPLMKSYSSDIFETGYNAIFTSFSKSFALHLAISITAMVTLFLFFDRLIVSSHKKTVSYKNFRNLVITSPNNQDYIPIEFQQLIKHIYGQYTKSASNSKLKQYADETLPKIVQRIYEQFPVRYRDKLETKHRLDSWIKWSIVLLVAAATLKLLTSAAKDGFDISERLRTVNPARRPHSQRTVSVDEDLDITNAIEKYT